MGAVARRHRQAVREPATLLLPGFRARLDLDGLPSDRGRPSAQREGRAAGRGAKPGNRPDEPQKQSIINHVRHELGPIATPSELVFVDKLPKTRSGKIVRRLLKAQEMGKDPGDLSTLED